MQFFLTFLASAMMLFFLSGCSSSDVQDSATAEGAFKLAQRYDDDERWEEAIAKYSEVKNKHPYSKYAIEAKLKIADVHFKKEDWIEAQHDYELFKEFHPKHARSDYVTYRLALSLFNQLPSTIDRDLSLAHKAITYFDEVVTSYPSSEYVKPSLEKKGEALKMLAEKEFYIASFYMKKEHFDSALGRFEGLLEKYPSQGFDDKALRGAALCAARLGDKQKATDYFSKLKQKFPKSDEYSKSTSEMRDYGIN